MPLTEYKGLLFPLFLVLFWIFFVCASSIFYLSSLFRGRERQRVTSLVALFFGLFFLFIFLNHFPEEMLFIKLSTIFKIEKAAYLDRKGDKVSAFRLLQTISAKDDEISKYAERMADSLFDEVEMIGIEKVVAEDRTRGIKLLEKRMLLGGKSGMRAKKRWEELTGLICSIEEEREDNEIRVRVRTKKGNRVYVSGREIQKTGEAEFEYIIRPNEILKDKDVFGLSSFDVTDRIEIENQFGERMVFDKVFSVPVPEAELVIFEPATDEVIMREMVWIKGRCEKGAELSLNDQRIKIDERSGNFSAPLHLPDEGEYRIVLTARKRGYREKRIEKVFQRRFTPKERYIHFKKSIDRSIKAEKLLTTPENYIGKNLEIRAKIFNVQKEKETNTLQVYLLREGSDWKGEAFVLYKGSDAKVRKGRIVRILGTVKGIKNLAFPGGKVTKMPVIVGEYIE